MDFCEGCNFPTALAWSYLDGPRIVDSRSHDLRYAGKRDESSADSPTKSEPVPHGAKTDAVPSAAGSGDQPGLAALVITGLALYAVPAEDESRFSYVYPRATCRPYWNVSKTVGLCVRSARGSR